MGSFYRPVHGQGPTASCGVALLARPGISVAPVTTESIGFYVPRSPRYGLWLVDGGFMGGHVVAILYLEDSSGMGETNMAILEQLASLLWALKKPFCIMADWDNEPEAFKGSGWVDSIGGTIVESGRPTCLQGDTARVYDYCVVSSHWLVPPTATLYEPWAPGPHTGILIEVPWNQPRVLVEVLRKPKTFPER